MWTHKSVSAGPAHIISVDIQLSERTTSRWLCQEIRNAGSWLPFISTVGGCRSNCSGATAVATAPPLGDEAAEVTTPHDTRAAAHAAGLVMPAFINAALIFC